jgi:hypothetical protein
LRVDEEKYLTPQLNICMKTWWLYCAAEKSCFEQLALACEIFLERAGSLRFAEIKATMLLVHEVLKSK